MNRLLPCIPFHATAQFARVIAQERQLSKVPAREPTIAAQHLRPCYSDESAISCHSSSCLFAQQTAGQGDVTHARSASPCHNQNQNQISACVVDALECCCAHDSDYCVFDLTRVAHTTAIYLNASRGDARDPPRPLPKQAPKANVQPKIGNSLKRQKS